MTEGGVAADRRVGVAVAQKRYVPYSHAHYGGNLVDGAYVLALFGDAATELSIRCDGDEGLLAAYTDVQFHAPVRGGDVIEVTATVLEVGRRSRRVALQAQVVCRAASGRAPSAAVVVDPPILATTATATIVVPTLRT